LGTTLKVRTAQAMRRWPKFARSKRSKREMRRGSGLKCSRKLQEPSSKAEGSRRLTLKVKMK